MEEQARPPPFFHLAPSSTPPFPRILTTRAPTFLPAEAQCLAREAAKEEDSLRPFIPLKRVAAGSVFEAEAEHAKEAAICRRKGGGRNASA